MKTNQAKPASTLTDIVDRLCSHLASVIKKDRSLATGDAGFEGLVARLLGVLTGQSFYVAASGLQPSGDAVAHTGTVSLQSKAYFGKKSPSVVSIIADAEVQFHSNLNLDVLVVALRELSAQNAISLESTIGSHGIEFLCIQCSDENPHLVCLLAKYWDHVHDHPVVESMPTLLQKEIAALTTVVPSKVERIIESLENHISHALQTYRSSQISSQAYLRGRFGIGAEAQGVGLFPIQLSQAIPREDSAKGFRDWWESDKSLLFVHGEEGCGKSWLLAQEAWRLAEPSNALVLWLDSIQWESATSLKDAVETALRACLGLPDSSPELALRLFRKIESRWKRPVLLVLDGMNERTCTATAERIIGTCFGRSSAFGADVGNESALDEAGADTDGWRVPWSLRVVFSTRSQPTDFLSLTSGQSSTFRVSAYSDNEFNKMLADNELLEGELPVDTTGLLRFPRFFSVFLRVRTKIGSGEVITPALIWWHDLLLKIEEGLDPAITTGLMIKSPRDAEELLTSIAEELSTKNELCQAQLNELFDGHYLDIRDQLLDSRVFSTSGRRAATISDDHISLAWGLIILRSLETAQEDETWTIADRIHKLLEPGLSDPRRAHGILVALQLSLTGEARLNDSAVGAGLLAWFSSHNVFGREDQLDFWCRERLNAYRLFVEGLLVSSHYGSPEITAVAPLARLWREDAPALREEMHSILRRWLLVTWSEGQPLGKTCHEWENMDLPVVANQIQLRLTPIAMSIISQRPDEALLPILAQCLATARVSTAIYENEKRHPAKWPHDVISTLLRWAYTETAIPAINKLIAEESVSDIRESLEFLASEGFGICSSAKTRSRPGPESVEQAIRQNSDPRTYLPDNPRSWVHAVGCLAVRDDLPDLKPDAQDEIQSLFRAACNPENDTIDRWLFEGLWPWVLKQNPVAFEVICAGTLCKTLTSDAGPNYDVLHHFQALLWQYKSETICDAISVCVQKDKKQLGPFTAEQLIEYLLFHGTDRQIQDYLIETENFRPERGGHLLVDLMSTTELLRILKPSCVLDLARGRCESLCFTPGWKYVPDTVEKLEYWLILWSNTTGRDVAAANWTADILINGCPSKCRTRCIRLLARSAREHLPELIYKNAALSQTLEDEDFVSMLRFGDLPQEGSRQLMLLWAARGTQLLAHSGRLLLKKNDEAGFHRWGCELLELSCQCAAGTQRDLPMPMPTLFELDSDGSIHFRGPAAGTGMPSIHCLGTDSWGIDEGVQPDSVEDPEAQFDEWRTSVAALQKWEGFSLRDFGDTYSVKCWAERHPAKFSAFCARFFPVLLASPENATRLGFFPHYLLSVMVHTDPVTAYTHWEALRVISNNYVYAVNHAEIVPAAVWNAALNETSGIADIRKATLLNADNDESVMGLALNTVRENTGQELIDICDEFLTSSLSKVRALAVSALAWTWHDSVITTLERLSIDDPSSWIRQHATWALDVQRQDSSCRRAYGRLLLDMDEYSMSRALHVMKPALLPSCMVWRNIEEATVAFPVDDCSPRKEALIRHFWHHWDCVSSHRHGTKALGRSMKTYLRGHKIDSKIEKQMAPWWTP